MKVEMKCAAAALGCVLALAAVNDATARTRRHHVRADQQAASVVYDNNGHVVTTGARGGADAEAAEGAGEVGRRGRRGRSVELGYARALGGSSDVVAEARRYLGGNPTGRHSLWCGAFVDYVLKQTGHAGGGNLARGYARYGTPVSGPQVGAIAVMSRRGGGHVGFVTGVDASGNVVVISGNHGNRVAESVYPTSRILAYVVPSH